MKYSRKREADCWWREYLSGRSVGTEFMKVVQLIEMVFYTTIYNGNDGEEHRSLISCEVYN